MSEYDLAHWYEAMEKKRSLMHQRAVQDAEERTDTPIIAGRSFYYYLEPPHFVYHQKKSEPMRDPVDESARQKVERFRRGGGPL